MKKFHMLVFAVFAALVVASLTGCEALGAFQTGLETGDEAMATDALGQLAATAQQLTDLGANVAGVSGMGQGVDAIVGTVGTLLIGLFGKKQLDGRNAAKRTEAHEIMVAASRVANTEQDGARSS